MMPDTYTLIRASEHAQRVIGRNRAGLLRRLREEREDFVPGEIFRICRFSDSRLCDGDGGCPNCLEVGFADPRTDAKIANIIIGGN